MPESSRARWIVVAALYTGLTLAYCRTLLPVLGSALPNDTGDPGLNAWILWWNAHAIPLTTRWWDAPIFYPLHGVLALSETFLNLWPLSTPLQWAGASATLTYNLMFLLSFPTAALAAHALARRLTGRDDAGLVAGLAYGFAPYRAAQMPHLQTLWSCWMPLGLLALHRFVETRRTRDLVLFSACWILNGLSTGYFLFFFAVLVGLWLVWFARTLRQWIAIGLASGIASLVLAPLLVGYQHYQSTLGVTRTGSEIEFYSADLSAIWAAHPYVLPNVWTFEPKAEGELYQGVAVALLILAGIVVGWRSARTGTYFRARRWLFWVTAALGLVTLSAWLSGGWAFRLAGMKVSFTHPAKPAFLTGCLAFVAACLDTSIVAAWRRRSPLMFYTIAAALMLLFALGPQARLFGSTFWAEAPYYWLMQLPGGHAFRVPSRFAMLLALCVSIAAALAFARLTAGRQASRLPRLMVVLVCLAIAVEGFVWNMGVAPLPPSFGTVGIQRGAVVLELPVGDTFSETAAMLRATRTGYTLVNGFSGYLPSSYNILKKGLDHFDGGVLDVLQRFGPLLVFVRRESDADDRYKNLLADRPDSRRVLADSSGTLFQLPGREPEPASSDRPLAVHAVRASVGNTFAAAMLDGDLTSRWQTPSAQRGGDEVSVMFDRPATVTRLELDLGPAQEDYPRRLRVSVAREGQPPQVVWEGGTAGQAMLAALTDLRRMPLVLQLPHEATGTGLVLTLTDGDDDYAWSIAELKVFGR